MGSKRKRDPVSVNLFILAFKAIFIMFKSNQNIRPQRIIDHGFLYIPYADEAVFFIKRKDLVIELLILIRLGGETPPCGIFCFITF